MLSARTASLLSATISVGVAIVGSAVFAVVAELSAEQGIGASAVRLLMVWLLTFGLVAGSVRLGLRIARSKQVQVWIAIAIPIVSFTVIWFLPLIPLERFGDKAHAMFAISHPTVLAQIIRYLVAFLEWAFVLTAVSVAFAFCARSWSVADA